jgi:uncharacterized protein involved in exopolysaccharide biosynthesis
MTGPVAREQPPTPPDASVFDLLIPVLRRWKLVVGLPLAAGLLAAVLSLILPPKYTASTSFVPAASSSGSSLPQGLQGLAGLAGLATQFGLNIGSGTAFSPDFFAEVLTSRELLRATLLTQFDDPRQPGSQRTLLDVLKVRGTTQERRMGDGIRRLRGATSEHVDRRTGIVTLEVIGRWPALAAAVANRMVELLNQFNLEQLQSQSRARRRFAGARKDQAEQEQREAEAQHLKFLQSNRRYDASPLLSFEQNRLSAQVQLRQNIVQTLTREYEEARIAEVRDTPVLTTIDPAVPPDRRTSPKRTLMVLLAMLASGFTALALVYVAEYQRVARLEHGSQYRAYLEAWRDAKAELRRALRIRNSR